MSESSAAKDNLVVRYFRDFNVLKETRREYWGIQAINVLDSTAYFAMLNIAVVSFSADFGYDDEQAGYMFTVFSSAVTIMLFFSGLLTDWLGIKRAVYVSMLGQALTRFGVVALAGMAPSGLRNTALIVMLLAMAPFTAMVQTMFQAANKRFTTKRSRGAGFNLWYLFMNVGAAAGGFVIDILYLNLGLPRVHVFTMGALFGLVAVVIALMTIRNTQQLYGPGEEADEAKDQAKAADEAKERAEGRGKGPWQIVKAVVAEPVFWRFTLLITLLLGVRAVFLYLSLLHPKFWLRVIGEDARIGFFQALNPILVIIGLILLIPILNRFNIYKMLVFGALITSVSLFIQAIPPMGGADVGEWTTTTTVIFLLVLTMGELIWSPRLQEYTAAIAPEGQEGTYLGLSMVPYFLAKTVVSVISGHMLQRWCPEGMGERLREGDVPFWDSPYAMWTILAAVALVGSLAALALRGWFTRGTELGRAPRPAEEKASAADA